MIAIYYQSGVCLYGSIWQLMSQISMKGKKSKRSFQYQAIVTRDSTPMKTRMMLLIWQSTMLTHYHSLNIFQMKVVKREILDVGWSSGRSLQNVQSFLGQYESIFKQYIFIKKMWNHKVKCRIFPKNEGYGIIISAFHYQQFGFGYPLTFPYIETIHKYRAPRPKYFYIDAATNIMVHTHK